MEYALVDAGIVVDMIVADADFIAAHGDEAKTQRGHSGSWIQCPAEQKVGIGFEYADETFTDPNAPEEP